MKTPEVEHAIDVDLVRKLISSQHPDLGKLEVRPLASGFDNELFRVGDDLVARLPRREVAATLTLTELGWLDRLPTLPIPIPKPVRSGTPGHGYPWRWSIVAWIEGAPADETPLCSDQAGLLGRFLKALHQPAPDAAPRNPFRAVPLHERRDAVQARMARVDLPAGATAAWREALDAPVATERRWVHGDLHPRNVIVREGRLAGVIDWGDLSGGDVATDLAGLWLLVDDSGVRDRVLEDYGVDEATAARARGWAVAFGAMLATISDDPRHQATGRAALQRFESGR